MGTHLFLNQFSHARENSFVKFHTTTMAPSKYDDQQCMVIASGLISATSAANRRHTPQKSFAAIFFAMPSFFMRDNKVEGLISSNWAAPSMPDNFQAHLSSAARM